MNSRSNNAPFTPDTAVFLQNCADFTARFPEQAIRLGLQCAETALQRLTAVPPEYRLVQTKAKAANTNSLQGNAIPALIVKEHFLHSQYNPQEEARRLLDSEFFRNKKAQSRCIFAGLGLGYLAVQYIERFPTAEAVIIEPDSTAFICFLAARKLTSFFRHQSISMLIGTTPDEAASFLSATGWNDSILFKSAPFIAVNKDWFDVFFTLLERDKMKRSINAKTLQCFGMLWLKNTVKNLEVLCSTAKIHCFKKAFSGAPAVILAGGPSLTGHLALIKKTERNFLIIAVDTALRACLQAEIVPDFILSFDPQYWNYLHIAGLDTSRSILISEASVFPAVLRQPYRAVFLSHSSVPFARYLEQDERESGDECILAAGGSVATTAWDFARYIGANPIIMAGLDLGYPQKQTHFTGSTFEEGAHTRSSRFFTAEQAHVHSLYAAFPSLHKDYAGGMVLTDRRMLLYAWWFESTLAQYPEVKTYNLVPHGVAIPGMPACTAEALPELTGGAFPRTALAERLQAIIDSAYSEAFLKNCGTRQRRLAAAVTEMTESAAELAQQAEQAQILCRRLVQCNCDSGGGEAGCNDKKRTSKKTALMKQLGTIDKNICNGFAKKILDVFFLGDEYDTENDSAVQAQQVYEKIRSTALQVYRVLKNKASLKENAKTRFARKNRQ